MLAYFDPEAGIKAAVAEWLAVRALLEAPGVTPLKLKLQSSARRGTPVEGGSIGPAGPRDGRAVRQERAGVFEDHDAIAEQAPALLRVTDDGACRLAVWS